MRGLRSRAGAALAGLTGVFRGWVVVVRPTEHTLVKLFLPKASRGMMETQMLSS